MKAERLEVWHTGTTSPIILVEITLVSFDTIAWSIKRPLSVSRCIELMNDLISGTDFKTKIIQWNIQRRICNFDPEMPLVGRKWFLLFMKRNPELVGKAGKKYSRNRAEHCHDSAFNKMCNQNEHLLVKSGNAVWLDSPVHMDIDGNIVEDEALAFGRPVNISITRPENVFVMDETGDNTHGKSDSIKGGEKKVVPAGEVPRHQKLLFLPRQLNVTY